MVRLCPVVETWRLSWSSSWSVRWNTKSRSTSPAAVGRDPHHSRVSSAISGAAGSPPPICGSSTSPTTHTPGRGRGRSTRTGGPAEPPREQHRRHGAGRAAHRRGRPAQRSHRDEPGRREQRRRDRPRRGHGRQLAAGSAQQGRPLRAAQHPRGELDIAAARPAPHPVPRTRAPRPARPALPTRARPRVASHFPAAAAPAASRWPP